MTWTYTNSPATVPVDEVRFLIGDIDTNDQQITDEGINYALGKNSDNALRAAAFCCRILASTFAREVDTQIDTIRISNSQKQSAYLKLAITLEEQAKKQGASAYGIPWVGGIDAQEVDDVRRDPNRVPSSFFIGQFDNPGTGSSGERGY